MEIKGGGRGRRRRKAAFMARGAAPRGPHASCTTAHVLQPSLSRRQSLWAALGHARELAACDALGGSAMEPHGSLQRRTRGAAFTEVSGWWVAEISLQPGCQRARA